MAGFLVYLADVLLNAAFLSFFVRWATGLHEFRLFSHFWRVGDYSLGSKDRVHVDWRFDSDTLPTLKMNWSIVCLSSTENSIDSCYAKFCRGGTCDLG